MDDLNKFLKEAENLKKLNPEFESKFEVIIKLIKDIRYMKS